MRKIIYDKYDKKAINALPREVFEGRIIVVISPAEAEKAVDYLLHQRILGFDTETRPSFKKGVRYEVSLLQVATHDTCFLFRLNVLGMSSAIIRLLEDTKVLKIGLSWHDDLMMLHRRSSFEAGTFLDIQNLVGELGIEDKSLQKLYANLLGKKISKTQRLTNWEHDVLDEKQKMYAATDAWACIRLYEEIEDLKKNKNYELVYVQEDLPQKE